MTRAAPSTLNDEAFFATLPEVSEFADLTLASSYRPAPASWSVVVTDVRGSTRAIEAGRYRDVNAVGAASIVAMRNALPELEIPYVFGGDGATLLVPDKVRPAAAVALRGVSALARDAFSLDLRVGIVPMADLLAAGHAIGVARYRASSSVRFAMFTGTGTSAAERLVKDADAGPRYAVGDGEARANFDGFECRWQPVRSQRGRVVSLLVAAVAGDQDGRARTYRDVLSTLDGLCDPEATRPVSIRGLRLGTLFSDYSTEGRVRSGRSEGKAYARACRHAREKAAVGRLLLGLGARAGEFDGRAYRQELIRNTDFRKFDDVLRMVLDLSRSEIDGFVAFLEAQRQIDRLVYGVHEADSALVTCFVRSYAGDHVHFVDGADGGYALAAKQLKQQMAARCPEHPTGVDQPGAFAR